MNNPSSPLLSAPPAGTSQGRIIVSTGATGVLGSKTAQAFASRGHSLVLLDNDQSKLDALTRELHLPAERLFASMIDLRNGEALRSTAEAVAVKFGGVQALIHLVGGWIGGKTIVESGATDLDFMLGQHVWTTFHLFQSFAPSLAKNGRGRVMIVSA